MAADLPEGPPSRKSTGGRRLSWADEGPPLSARPIADEIEVPKDDVVPIEIDPAVAERILKGEGEEQTLALGILRQGNLYGISTPLPEGTTAAEILPLPTYITARVDENQDTKVLSLCLEVEYTGEGRFFDTVRMKLTGAKKPEFFVHVDAKSMAPRDGRPASSHSGLRLLRSASQELAAAMSEAAEWKRGESAMDDDQGQGSP